MGPGIMVTAAFIGPGTVTLCSLAGVHFGYSLLWAVLLSTLATVVLQDMAARIGLISQSGLAQLLRSRLKGSLWKTPILTLIILAIVLGNTAYQAGNIGGGVLGLEALVGALNYSIIGQKINIFPLVLGGIAFVLLSQKNDKLLSQILTVMVLFMSCSFVITAWLIKPQLRELLSGLFVPSFPKDSLWTIIGLVGTTIVPYNIFLHASLIHKKWRGVESLSKVQRDTYWSIGLGGLVSLSIVVCAAGSGIEKINTAVDLAQALSPLYGSMAKLLLGVGLFSAGMTSAITAPLAAAYVACECLGWSTEVHSQKFQLVWRLVLLVGVVLAAVGIKPIALIHMAQVANGMLLFVMAGLVLWMINQQSVMNQHVNTKWQNILGAVVLILSIIVGVKGIDGVLQIFG
ncbi:MAG: Nramp family divalent metal transporter [Flavobacteriaceae bacterium]|jgi:manganese transport protein|nr:Nramp family divalent metal transporter [Flavobacteriaceae bacterium]MDP4795188.1 Nramp family divalent metal transporter [Flavobacteriaceae bacterium]MDP4971852.1 Nramp family divalent metal transporter [Flavobacteriaceae bacterium]